MLNILIIHPFLTNQNPEFIDDTKKRSSVLCRNLPLPVALFIKNLNLFYRSRISVHLRKDCLTWQGNKSELKVFALWVKYLLRL